jgi:hypothetical protein
MDIVEIREGLVVFGIAPWGNCLPKPEYDDGPFFDEGQTDIGDGIYDRKRNEALYTMTANIKKTISDSVEVLYSQGICSVNMLQIQKL